MFHDLDNALTAILDDGTAPTELHDADVSFETPDRNFAPGQPTVNLCLNLPERFKGFWEFAQEIECDRVSEKLQCWQRLQTQERPDKQAPQPQPEASGTCCSG